ncbi:MAG: hypothetical protein M3444_06600 [Acidobacteriota bacterium]|nr:hypothetical protein [Acidobacteriota bacterium]MDQ5835273.1 hypothetical protein [Acidobacteriota bacterium]
MGQVIKVRCNGPNRHVNEVDLDAALREETITRGADAFSGSAPERVVLRCRECVDGSVILTRAMIEEARRQHRSM